MRDSDDYNFIGMERAHTFYRTQPRSFKNRTILEILKKYQSP